jgi:ABC-type bacteriocin/lantibiotic exporter with double-glycine peptidase domain
LTLGNGDVTRFTPRLQLLLAVLCLGWSSVAPAGSPPATGTGLRVPIVKQAPERCGQAALEMVLRYYGAESRSLHEADRAYDPALRGSLITDLAAAARRAGYEAVIATLTPDSLIALLAAGVPPVVLYQNGPLPLTVPHYGVVTGWDPARAVFTLNDGGAHPRVVRRNDLARRWRTAGFQALIVRRRGP